MVANTSPSASRASRSAGLSAPAVFTSASVFAMEVPAEVPSVAISLGTSPIIASEVAAPPLLFDLTSTFLPSPQAVSERILAIESAANLVNLLLLKLLKIIAFSLIFFIMVSS